MFRFSQQTRTQMAELARGLGESADKPWWFDHFGAHVRNMSTERGLTKCLRALEHDIGLLKTDIAGKRILDAGCGSGIIDMLLVFEGAAEVQLVDIWDETISFVEGYMKDLLGNEVPMRISKQDAGSLSFEDCYFDIVFCREAISHFHDVTAFLREAARVLKRGGKLFLSDSNNGANILKRRATMQIWHCAENGPPCDDCHGHRIDKPMIDRRRDTAKEHFPDLDPNDLAALASHTFQMTNAQVIEAGKRFRETGEMPNSVYSWGQCPREPETGMYLERLFVPSRLARELDKEGFDTRVYAYFSHGRHPALATISRALEKISPLVIYLAPMYQIVAVKR
jgi:ubiquinone/menaquinone biosynthesis C-methylase UbiE